MPQFLALLSISNALPIILTDLRLKIMRLSIMALYQIKALQWMSHPAILTEWRER